MSIYPQRIGSGPAAEDPMIGMGLAGRYRILHRLGVGGMGVVYCARQAGMDRDVAIKIMLPNMAADAVEVQRFLSEARIAGGLGHPHIVEVFDMGKLDDGRPYLVMPRLEGKGLDELLERNTRLDPTHVATIVRGVASALDVLHARHIVHRDLKPQNLFLSRQPDGTRVIKLLDFGLATLVGERDVRLTRTDMIVGTPQYLAPEAGDGRMLDARGDVYSLACIVYQALAGKLPIEGTTPGEIMRRKMALDAPPLSAHGVAVSADVETAMKRALHYDPEQRYQRAGDFAEDFVAAITEQFGPVPRSIHMDERCVPRLHDPRAHETKTRTMEDAVQADLLQVFDPQPTTITPVNTAVTHDGSTAAWGHGRKRVPPGPSEAEAADPNASDAEHILPVGEPPAHTRMWVAALVLLGLGAGLATWRGTRPTPQDGTHASADGTLAARERGVPVSPRVSTHVQPESASVHDHVSRVAEPELIEREQRVSATGRNQAPPPSTRVGAVPSNRANAPSAAVQVPPVAAGAVPESRVTRIAEAPAEPTADRERASELVSEGTRLLVGGQLPEAVSRFRAATYANPGNVAAWRGLGLGYQRMGQNPEARTAFERYLRLAPNARDAELIRTRLASL